MKDKKSTVAIMVVSLLLVSSLALSTLEGLAGKRWMGDRNALFRDL